MSKIIEFPKQMKTLPLDKINALIDMAFTEDFGTRGDITTQALLGEIRKPVHAKVIAKEDGIVCGTDIFKAVYQKVDPTVEIMLHKHDGDRVVRGEKIADLNGLPASITGGERVSLNFLGMMSGIATKAGKLAFVLKGTKTRVIDTRKTLPGLREVQKYAVYTGGGWNHRIGLFDMFLIKDNHIAAVGGITEAVKRAKKFDSNVPVEVETSSLAQVEEALKTEADILMLDNMDNALVQKAVEMIGGKKMTEVSGNVDEKRLMELSSIGVDFVSMGALTHTIKPLDISLLIEG